MGIEKDLRIRILCKHIEGYLYISLESGLTGWHKISFLPPKYKLNNLTPPTLYFWSLVVCAFRYCIVLRIWTLCFAFQTLKSNPVGEICVNEGLRNKQLHRLFHHYSFVSLAPWHFTGPPWLFDGGTKHLYLYVVGCGAAKCINKHSLCCCGLWRTIECCGMSRISQNQPVD